MAKKEDFREKTRRLFDREAGHYEQTRNGRHAAALYGSVLEELGGQRYGSVLDVGCGTGALLKQIHERAGSEVSLAGIDLSANMIAEAKTLLGGQADLREGDAENLPWDEESFDLILCVDSLHHYTGPARVLQEMRRVLKPMGKLVVADPIYGPLARPLINLFLSLNPSGDYRVYSKNELERMLESAGFYLMDWKQLPENTYILKAAAQK